MGERGGKRGEGSKRLKHLSTWDEMAACAWLIFCAVWLMVPAALRRPVRLPRYREEAMGMRLQQSKGDLHDHAISGRRGHQPARARCDGQPAGGWGSVGRLCPARGPVGHAHRNRICSGGTVSESYALYNLVRPDEQSGFGTPVLFSGNRKRAWESQCSIKHCPSAAAGGTTAAGRGVFRTSSKV